VRGREGGRDKLWLCWAGGANGGQWEGQGKETKAQRLRDRKGKGTSYGGERGEKAHQRQTRARGNKFKKEMRKEET